MLPSQPAHSSADSNAGVGRAQIQITSRGSGRDLAAWLWYVCRSAAEFRRSRGNRLPGLQDTLQSMTPFMAKNCHAVCAGLIFFRMENGKYWDRRLDETAMPTVWRRYQTGTAER